MSERRVARRSEANKGGEQGGVRVCEGPRASLVWVRRESWLSDWGVGIEAFSEFMEAVGPGDSPAKRRRDISSAL